MVGKLISLSVVLLGLCQPTHAINLSLTDLIGTRGSENAGSEAADGGTSDLDDTFLQISDLPEEESKLPSDGNEEPMEVENKTQSLVLAQTTTHQQREQKSKRALSVIQHFEHDLHRVPSQALKDGYWVIICKQLSDAVTPEELAYSVQLDHSEQVYSKMQKEADYRVKILKKCKFSDEAQYTEKNNLVDGLATVGLDKQEKWVYRKPHQMVNIKGRYSKDLSLFYTEDDVRSLFSWRRPLYQNICKFMSQQYLGYSELTNTKRLNLLMEMQAVLTETHVFNLLTEDNQQRELLYKVCKASKFPTVWADKSKPLFKGGLKQIAAKSDTDATEPEEVKSKKHVVNPSFEALFPTMHDFDKIFD